MPRKVLSHAEVFSFDMARAVIEADIKAYFFQINAGIKTRLTLIFQSTLEKQSRF